MLKPMMPQPQSGNQRIELRAVGLHHAADLLKLMDANREHLRRWHPWVDDLRSVADVETRISTWKEQQAANRGFHAGIWFDGQLCGVIGHPNVDWVNRWTALSYWLDAAHQGQGIMTICCRALITHAFKAWQLNRILIECAVENVRSRAIPERLGFKLEGIVRGAEWLHERYADHAIYGLLYSDCQWLSSVSTIPNREHTWNRPKPAEPECQPNDSFERSLMLAFEMEHAGRTKDAEAICRVLVQVRPNDGQLLLLLGMILHKTGREQEAAQWLSRAAQYQPPSAIPVGNGR